MLGVKFTKQLSELTEINYLSKIDEMKKLFLNWSKRILTPIEKITLSKINNLTLSFSFPKLSEKKIIKDIQNGGQDNIKRSVAIKNYDCGGLRMIDVDSFINSIKLTWLRRI